MDEVNEEKISSDENEIGDLDYAAPEKYRAIMFGSTGTLGRGVLQALKESRSCEKILAITRGKLLHDDHPKLENIVWKNFDEFLTFKKKEDISEDIIDLFKGYDVCFNFVGISSAKVSGEEYHKIIYSYGTRLAHLCAEAKIGVYYFTSTFEASYYLGRFVISGYTQKKTEEYISTILSMSFKNYTFVRPGFVVDKRKPWITNCILANCLGPLIGLCICSRAVSISQKKFGKAVINHFEEKKDEDGDEKGVKYELWASDLLKYGKL